MRCSWGRASPAPPTWKARLARWWAWRRHRVPPDVKFCGLTRPDDAAHAVALGAAYTGVIFAGGPRQLDTERARAVLTAARHGARRVGVFAARPTTEIAAVARELELDAVQLHGDSTPAAID